jgi:LacI family transcriptional regulator
MLAAGLEPIVVTHGEPREIDAPAHFVTLGESALPALLEHPARPTAVVCYNDQQAVGIIRAARRLNVAVPGRLSVVGFGDRELSRVVDPALTTQRLPALDIGCEAATMIAELIEGRPVESVTVPCELVVRESTAEAAQCSEVVDGGFGI